MTSSNLAPAIDQLSALLQEYSFEGAADDPTPMVEQWLTRFEPLWVGQAIVEALYQGRYKLVSIDQILLLWQRRGHPIRHFSREFESIVLRQTGLGTSAAVAEPAPADRAGEGQEAPAIAADLPAPEGAAAPPVVLGFRNSPPLPLLPPAAEVSSAAIADALKSLEAQIDLTHPLPSASPAGDHSPSLPLLGDRLGDSPTSIPPAPSAPPPVDPNRPPVAEDRLDASEPWLSSTPSAPAPEPIQPFVPSQDGSSVLHRRLRAVVRGNGDNR